MAVSVFCVNFDGTNRFANVVKVIHIMKRDEIFLQIHDKKSGEIRFIQLRTVNDLNHAIRDGYTKDVINMSEIMMDKRIDRIADTIANRGNVRVVLISGPSSSGKTTFSKRLSLHLLANHLKPYPVSLDDYFVDRTRTPIDENGEYDYESIHAVDLDLLHRHIDILLSGGEVELPRYDFASGTSQMSGHRLHLDDDMILIFEGIHGLNPLLTDAIADEAKYRVYVSSLAPIQWDDESAVSRTDSRLIRRILRDYRYRGASPQATIDRWPSVRRGEDKWVFPFQQYADTEFNSVQFYELSVLRNKVLPILAEITPDQPQYPTSDRLRRLLLKFKPIDDFSLLPPVSLLREFMGGSSFNY